MYIESLFRNSLHYSVPGAPLYGSLNPRRPENCVWWVLFVRWLGRPVNGSPTTMNLYPLIFIAVFTHGCERTHTHTHTVCPPYLLQGEQPVLSPTAPLSHMASLSPWTVKEEQTRGMKMTVVPTMI